jgi:hypothetical protein
MSSIFSARSKTVKPDDLKKDADANTSPEASDDEESSDDEGTGPHLELEEDHLPEVEEDEVIEEGGIMIYRVDDPLRDKSEEEQKKLRGKAQKELNNKRGTGFKNFVEDSDKGNLLVQFPEPGVHVYAKESAKKVCLQFDLSSQATSRKILIGQRYENKVCLMLSSSLAALKFDQPERFSDQAKFHGVVQRVTLKKFENTTGIAFNVYLEFPELRKSANTLWKKRHIEGHPSSHGTAVAQARSNLDGQQVSGETVYALEGQTAKVFEHPDRSRLGMLDPEAIIQALMTTEGVLGTSGSTQVYQFKGDLVKAIQEGEETYRPGTMAEWFLLSYRNDINEVAQKEAGKKTIGFRTKKADGDAEVLRVSKTAFDTVLRAKCAQFEPDIYADNFSIMRLCFEPINGAAGWNDLAAQPPDTKVQLSAQIELEFLDFLSTHKLPQPIKQPIPFSQGRGASSYGTNGMMRMPTSTTSTKSSSTKSIWA